MQNDSSEQILISKKVRRQILSERLPYTPIEIIWSARYEMARTVEDILARRQRALFLDAEAAMEMAPEVARIMAAELGRDKDWQRGQVEQFTELVLVQRKT